MQFRKLRADEIDCRISQCNQYGVGLLLYKDARCDMNILDETVGAERWQRHHELINGNLFCNVGINFPDASGFDRWVWKQDVGTESNTEKEKGQASDSFKRACFNWGIGRELYTAPDMFVKAKDLKTLKNEPYNGKEYWKCKDSFTVKHIEYYGEKIVYVRVLNEKTGCEIEFGRPSNAVAEVEKIENSVVSQAKVTVIRNKCTEFGVSESQVCGRFGIERLEDMTEEMFMRALKGFNATEKK